MRSLGAMVVAADCCAGALMISASVSRATPALRFSSRVARPQPPSLPATARAPPPRAALARRLARPLPSSWGSAYRRLVFRGLGGRPPRLVGDHGRRHRVEE